MEFGISSSLNQNKMLILLTGCINPRGMTLTKLQDPKVRMQQYLDSITYYLSSYDLKVLFVENSNVDITPYLPESINKSRLEILTFDGNNFNKSLGKGYGEMAILRHALAHSTFLAAHPFVFKITGRHKVLNLQSIINQFLRQRDIDLLADLRDMTKYVDSRCWGATTNFIDRVFMKYMDQVNDDIGINFEHVLAKALHEAVINGYKFEQMKNLARLSGSSGTQNTKFNDSWIYWFPRDIAHQIKYILNKR